ncbi:hypothetical protein HDU84_008363, partial [Entophlyctis sp. JEL0112]
MAACLAHAWHTEYDSEGKWAGAKTLCQRREVLRVPASGTAESADECGSVRDGRVTRRGRTTCGRGTRGAPRAWDALVERLRRREVLEMVSSLAALLNIATLLSSLSGLCMSSDIFGRPPTLWDFVPSVPSGLPSFGIPQFARECFGFVRRRDLSVWISEFESDIPRAYIVASDLPVLSGIEGARHTRSTVHPALSEDAAVAEQPDDDLMEETVSKQHKTSFVVYIYEEYLHPFFEWRKSVLYGSPESAWVIPEVYPAPSPEFDYEPCYLEPSDFPTLVEQGIDHFGTRQDHWFSPAAIIVLDADGILEMDYAVRCSWAAGHAWFTTSSTLAGEDSDRCANPCDSSSSAQETLIQSSRDRGTPSEGQEEAQEEARICKNPRAGVFATSTNIAVNSLGRSSARETVALDDGLQCSAVVLVREAWSKSPAGSLNSLFTAAGPSARFGKQQLAFLPRKAARFGGVASVRVVVLAACGQIRSAFWFCHQRLRALLEAGRAAAKLLAELTVRDP